MRISDCRLRNMRKVGVIRMRKTNHRSIRNPQCNNKTKAIRNGRKGQWFLIGGLILAMLLSYVAATRGQISVGDDAFLERDFAFSNLKSAMRSTLSEIVAENTSEEHIEGRLLDLKYMLDTFAVERASNISGFVLLGVPHTGYVNATIMNFFHQNMAGVTLYVGSASVPSFGMSDGAISTFYLAEGANYFPVNMTYTINTGSGPEQESVAFNTTRKAFFIFKLNLARRSGTQVMQDIVYG